MNAFHAGYVSAQYRGNQIGVERADGLVLKRNQSERTVLQPDLKRLVYDVGLGEEVVLVEDFEQRRYP